MKKITLAAASLGIAATTAQAGEIQRAPDVSQILYENGKTYLEFSASVVTPDVRASSSALGASGSGNMTARFQNYAVGFKQQVNEKLTYAIVANQPYGANVDYAPATGYPFAGSNAELDVFATTGYLKYQFDENFSAYGGLRVQGMKGNLNITFPIAYALNVDYDWQMGYVIGGAYERRDIALKVALTYESEIEHGFSDNTGTPFEVKTPQAVTLHVQSGIAAATLLFGSIRWQEWTEFQIAPQDFTPGAIALGRSDIWSYEIGVGRRFNENWSGALTLGYEEDQDDIVGNLSGKDGYVSYGVGVSYATESWELSTGVRYIALGDAVSQGINGNFTSNDAIAVGMKLGFRF